MSSNYQEALAQVRAANEDDAKRTEQYVVPEPSKIVEEVSQEEYTRIVAERREEFVVGERTRGYSDGGKEIWEVADAARESDLSTQPHVKGLSDAPSPSKRREPTVPAERPKGNLLQALHAGASASPTDVPSAVQETPRQKDLDNMLQMFCSQLEAGDSDATQPAATQGSAASGKRRNESSGATRTSKKHSSRKAKEAEAPPAAAASSAAATAPASPAPLASEVVVLKKELPESGAALAQPEVRVKREFEEAEEAKMCTASEVDPAAALPTQPEPAVKPEKRVKVELTDIDKKSEAVKSKMQLQEWLQTGLCQGVKAEPADTQQTQQETATLAEPVRSQLRLEEDGGLWFFFMDAFEDDRASPPRVYLFGKVQAANAGGFQSTCLVVERLERCVHLLLNVDPDNTDAVEGVASQAEVEFDSICRRQAPGVRKLRAKLKWRNYAFEKSLPHGAGYLPFLKVTCDASGFGLPLGMQGSAFSQAFGAQTSLLEKLLLSRRIMGPAWLRLHPDSWTETPGKLSFCPVELHITPASIVAPKTPQDVRQLQDMGMPTSSPPFRVLSINLQTVQKSPQEPHEVVAAACSLHPNFSTEATNGNEVKVGTSCWKAIRRFDARPLPRDADRVLAQQRVEHHNSEVALMNALLAKIQEFDPDVIAAHNAYGFDLDVIASRLHHLKLHGWQKLGRLRRPRDRMPRIEGRQGVGFWVGSNITAGRLVCDVVLQARDLLPKLGAYDLSSLVRHQLGVEGLQVVEPEQLPRCFDSSEALVGLANQTLNAAVCVAHLAHSLQILPLTRQLTCLAGNLWNASLQNKRAERNEMLLCHEFHRKKFVLPDKESAFAKKRRGGGLAPNSFDDPDGPGADAEGGAAPAASGPRRGKAAYSGGLVLEPKVGLYEEYVMLLDFNSLYPSIIQEHNICFTTVDRPDEKQMVRLTTEVALLGQTRTPDGTVEEGVLPQVIRRLVDSRRTVKSAMKSERDPKRMQTLEIRQLALKLTANSMYGCLGFQNSRFYAKPLAALITAKGREALQTTITVVEQECQLDVVYGDTDSVFVNTKTADFAQAMQAAEQIKRAVNKRYKRLEIEIDGVFARLMLLKKKKYAALKVVTKGDKREFQSEIKGLDIVRRDWCGFAKDIGQEVLMKVLCSELGKEEAVHWTHEFLTSKAKEMDEGTVPLERYVIVKSLTKDPKDYPDAKNLPHVQVALRLIQRGRPVSVGEEIPYIISNAAGEGTKSSLAERCRHPHEFQLDSSLRVDVEWYKKQQVHPLVTRLLGPVEGTDAARIAECLGMDGSRFAQAAAARAAAEDGAVDGTGGFVEAVSADVNALFDRKVRWKEFHTALPGVQCPKCKAMSPWKELLQPQAWEADAVKALFCCSACKEPINPRVAQNLLTLQLRGLLKEHSEGWVMCPDDNYIEKTRRLAHGKNLVSERTVLSELEYIEHLCEAEQGYNGEDKRGCRDAAQVMRNSTRQLLECNGYNWVDCGQVFGSIFVQAGGK